MLASVLFTRLPGRVLVKGGEFANPTSGARRRLRPDNRNRLYVLELSSTPGFPTPGAGKLVRVSSSGQTQDIITGLVVPTAMTIGPDGAIYISNFGAAAPGLGQILRVEITD